MANEKQWAKLRNESYSSAALDSVKGSLERTKGWIEISIGRAEPNRYILYFFLKIHKKCICL